MKKILIGFIAIGLLTFVGCEKDDDTETTDSTETSSDEGTDSSTDDDTETSSDEGSTDTSDEGTDSSTDDDTTETSSSGVVYGDGVTDASGNTYQSVIIGTQEWMSENLRTSKYSDGADIPNVTGNSAWKNLSTGAWCHYDNDSQYDTIYGKLYNWYAVETGKLCPTDWHVPTDEEWYVLTDYLVANGHSETEGKVLKATSGWNSDVSGTDRNGTDDYGWNGVGGGWLNTNTGVWNNDIGYKGYWWSSNAPFAQRAFYFRLRASDDKVKISNWPMESGMSVRCLRD